MPFFMPFFLHDEADQHADIPPGVYDYSMKTITRSVFIVHGHCGVGEAEALDAPALVRSDGTGNPQRCAHGGSDHVSKSWVPAGCK